ncbi:rRNA pseudouridine synthase [Candidatus Saganbacteria bacterium]|nr:rRNA pseudouridine synthase [Candidatus Saganbacteria bacterium]
MEIRLQKHMAQCGIASRRQAEAMIRAGQVKVNGKVVTELGTKIDPDKDQVTVTGSPPIKQEKKVYYKIFKPVGIVSACSDAHEKTVIDLMKNIPFRLYSVGRLDKESEGLLILTNDGEVSNQLMHPRYEHEKEYVVHVQRPMQAKMLVALEQGMMLDGEQTLPTKIVLVEPKAFRIVLREGKNRQIRRMVEAVGNRVTYLKRLRVGKIKLGTLNPGEYAPLSEAEMKELIKPTAN